MDTMEDILEDCNEVFRYDETRPQDRAHAYLKEHRVCRGYDDTAMERAAQDMIERAYTVGWRAARRWRGRPRASSPRE